MNTQIQQTIKHWRHIRPYANIPNNESEYKELLVIVDELMQILRQSQDKDENITSFLKLVSQSIEAYETRRYLRKPLSAIEMLKFLMKEHDLGQGDLPEIGGQSHVSKILNGQRHLTAKHISKLSKRFGVSPSVFYQEE